MDLIWSHFTLMFIVLFFFLTNSWIHLHFFITSVLHSYDCLHGRTSFHTPTKSTITLLGLNIKFALKKKKDCLPKAVAEVLNANVVRWVSGALSGLVTEGCLLSIMPQIRGLFWAESQCPSCGSSSSTKTILPAMKIRFALKYNVLWNLLRLQPTPPVVFCPPGGAFLSL